MRVVHIELPRHFTYSIKEYLLETDAALTSAGHAFRQFDVNPNFWSWLLALSTPHSPADCLAPLLEATRGDDLFARLADLSAHLSDMATLYGVSFTLAGLALPTAVADSAYAMCALTSDNYGCGLFANFFHHIAGLTGLLDADILSLGVDSQAGVFWAIQLAAWVRSAGSRAHITVGRHSYENFSLVHHVEALAQNPWFFGLIDSVIVHEELLPDTMTHLAEHCDGRSSSLSNLAIRGDDGEVHVTGPGGMQAAAVADDYRIPEGYFHDTGAPPELLVYTMSMVRNKCFYSRCTFCAQITKHLPGLVRAAPQELTRALSAADELRRHGVGMVNYHDEAMRPVDAVAFSRELEAKGAPLQWVGRMIAAANTNRDDLRRMRDGGCREILFGLETFDPAVARDMGKVTGRTDTDPIAVIESVLGADLFLILSMIYSFPTETSAARTQTLRRVQSVQQASDRVGVIFNRFQLFHTSTIYQEPNRFNIERVESPSPDRDIQFNFNYELRKSRSAATESQLNRMEMLQMGLDSKSHRKARHLYGNLLRMAYQVDYSSLGLWHRAHDGRTLLQRAFAGAL